jgi:hypothetical protein
MTTFTESQGVVRFPLLASDLSSDAVVPDQLLETLFDLFKTAVEAELTAAWPTIVAGTSLSDTSDPVTQDYKGLLTPAALLETRFTFPLLALGRVGTTEYPEQGLDIDAIQQQWALHWVLGPMNPSQYRRFEAACTAWFPRLVKGICERGGRHPSFTPSGINGDGKRADGTDFEAGDTPFGPGGINLGSIKLAQSSSDPTVISGDKPTTYYGCTCTLETVEYDSEELSNFAGFNEAGVSIAVGGGTEGLIPDFIKREWKGS